MKIAIIFTKKTDVYPSSLNFNAGSSISIDDEIKSSTLKLDFKKSNSANPKS